MTPTRAAAQRLVPKLTDVSPQAMIAAADRDGALNMERHYQQATTAAHRRSKSDEGRMFQTEHALQTQFGLGKGRTGWRETASTGEGNKRTRRELEVRVNQTEMIRITHA